MAQPGWLSISLESRGDGSENGKGPSNRPFNREHYNNPWDLGISYFQINPSGFFSHRGNDDKPRAREDDLGIKSIFRAYNILASQGHQQIWLKRAVPKPASRTARPLWRRAKWANFEFEEVQSSQVHNESGELSHLWWWWEIQPFEESADQGWFPCKEVAVRDAQLQDSGRCNSVVFSTEATNQTIQICINENDGERKRDLYQYGAWFPHGFLVGNRFGLDNHPNILAWMVLHAQVHSCVAALIRGISWFSPQWPPNSSL